MRIRWLPRAVRDVDEIWDWIGADDPNAADRVVREIAAATARLADFPKSGTPRPELLRDVRSVVTGHYVIFYRLGPDCVDVIRVRHGARDLSGLFEPEREGSG